MRIEQVAVLNAGSSRRENPPGQAASNWRTTASLSWIFNWPLSDKPLTLNLPHHIRRQCAVHYCGNALLRLLIQRGGGKGEESLGLERNRQIAATRARALITSANATGFPAAARLKTSLTQSCRPDTALLLSIARGGLTDGNSIYDYTEILPQSNQTPVPLNPADTGANLGALNIQAATMTQWRAREILVVILCRIKPIERNKQKRFMITNLGT